MVESLLANMEKYINEKKEKIEKETLDPVSIAAEIASLKQDAYLHDIRINEAKCTAIFGPAAVLTKEPIDVMQNYPQCSLEYCLYLHKKGDAEYKPKEWKIGNSNCQKVVCDHWTALKEISEARSSELPKPWPTTVEVNGEFAGYGCEALLEVKGG